MAHTAFDGESIYSVDQNLSLDEYAIKNRRIEDHMQRFKFFLRDWSENNRYKYREQIMKAKPGEDTLMELDLDDITAFDDDLMQGLSNYPDEYISRFEEVTSQIYSELHEESYKDHIASFQIELTSSQKPRSLRDLTSDLVGKLVVVPGIVVSCSKPAIKAYRVAIQCKGCQQEQFVPVESGMSGIEIPRTCIAPRPQQGVASEKCPRDPYVIIPERCLYTLHQTMKIQESPENVPVGEMPRSFQVTCRGKAVDKVTPGIKVTLIAMLCLPDSKASKASVTRSSYLKAAGIKLDKTVESKLKNFFTLEDEDTFRELARDPQIYEKLAKSVAPSIYGNDDIKKAIACMLFGGTRKKVPEGIRLRGDINVLMLGDPSTAKSQFLKFVHRVAPISVYTSGKGSSAAGLTASVTRDAHTREFQLEGGAMVLADGGVVCIDEFDKMQASDRVAIHEAMEQQTISVAKAGITTILNTRVSVLAAANPSAGTYDDLKQAQEQIEFQSTILSRFDTIFLVRDNRDPAHDRLMASHILNLHMSDSNTAESGEIDINDLKKYIAFARYKCFPRISQESGDALINFYVNDRAKNSNGAFPITVRQLEAIVRLSEALAKMKLSEVVTKADVEEAHRLFEVSTLNASLAGISSSGVHVSREVAEIALKVEESIRRMVGINSRISYETLKEKLETRYQNKEAIKHAIVGMITRGELEHRAQQSKLVRIK